MNVSSDGVNFINWLGVVSVQLLLATLLSDNGDVHETFAEK